MQYIILCGHILISEFFVEPAMCQNGFTMCSSFSGNPKERGNLRQVEGMAICSVFGNFLSIALFKLP
jgi:hypothetical protein